MKNNFKIFIRNNLDKKILFSEYNPGKSSITIEETFTEEENNRYVLNFKILKKYGEEIQNNFKIEDFIKIGRGIVLENEEFPSGLELVISSISPEGSEDNIVWNVTCQDFASYVFSRNNVDFFLDTIQDEEYLIWLESNSLEGNARDIINYILQQGFLQQPDYITLSTPDEKNWKAADQVNSKGTNPLKGPLFEKINLVVSSSNTYNALVELALLLNSFLLIDYENKVFDLVSKDDDIFRKNYLLTPEFNLQNLSLDYNGDSLAPILYVIGGEDELGITVSMIPFFNYSQYKRVLDYSTKIKLNSDITIDSGTITTTTNQESNNISIKVNGEDSFPNSDSIWEDQRTITIGSQPNNLSLSILFNGRPFIINNISNNTIRFTPQGDKWELKIFSGTTERFSRVITFSSFNFIPVLINPLSYYDNPDFYSSIAWEGFEPGNNELGILDRIPYLDSFIINLDYFKRNKLIEDQDYENILFKIFNELRLINLIYQRLVYNKFTAEGEINRIESSITSYAELLARSEENDYINIENTLNRILIQQGGGILQSQSRSSDLFSDEVFEFRDDNNDLLAIRSIRFLISNSDLPAYFYKISEDVFDFFIGQGFQNVTNDLISNSSFQLVPNKVFTNYNNGQLEFFVTVSYLIDYPASIKFRTPRFQNYTRNFDSFGETQEIDELPIAVFQNSNLNYFKYQISTGLKFQANNFSNNSDFFEDKSNIFVLTGTPTIPVSQNNIEFFNTSAAPSHLSGTVTSSFSGGSLGEVIGNFFSNSFYFLSNISPTPPFFYSWTHVGFFNQTISPGFDLNRVYRINTAQQRFFWIFADIGSGNNVLLNINEDAVFINRFPYIRNFFNRGEDSTEKLFQLHPGLKVPIGYDIHMKFDQSNLDQTKRFNGSNQINFEIQGKTFSEGTLYGTYWSYDDIANNTSQPFNIINRFRDGFIKVYSATGLVFINNGSGIQQAFIASTVIRYFDTDNENYIALAYPSGNNMNLDIYFIDASFQVSLVRRKVVSNYLNSTARLVKPFSFVRVGTTTFLYFLQNFRNIFRWVSTSPSTDELWASPPTSVTYVETGTKLTSSNELLPILFAFYVSEDWTDSIGQQNATNSLFIKWGTVDSITVTVENVGPNIKTAKWLEGKNYFAFSGYREGKVKLIDMRLGAANWAFPNWETNAYSPNGTNAELRHIDFKDNYLYIIGTSGISGNTIDSRVNIKRYLFSGANNAFWSKSEELITPYYAPVVIGRNSFFVKDSNTILFAPLYLFPEDLNTYRKDSQGYTPKFILQNANRLPVNQYPKNRLLIENNTQKTNQKVSFFETDWLLSNTVTSIKYQDLNPEIFSSRLRFQTIPSDTVFEVLPYFELMRTYSGFDYIKEKEYKHLDVAQDFINEKNSILADLDSIDLENPSGQDLLEKDSLETQLNSLRAAVGDASGLVIDNLRRKDLYQSNFRGVRDATDIKWEATNSVNSVINKKLVNTLTGTLNTASTTISIKDQIKDSGSTTFLVRAKIKALGSPSKVLIKTSTNQEQNSVEKTFGLNDWFELVLVSTINSTVLEASLIIEHQYPLNTDSIQQKIEIDYVELIDLTKMQLDNYILNTTLSSFSAWELERRYFKGEETLYPTYPGKFTLIYEKYKSAFEDFLLQEPFSIGFKDTVLGKLILKKQEKDKFWFDLKKEYGRYLYEGFYENNLESDFVSLYKQGLENSKKYDRPNENYSLTYIDASDIIGINIEQIKVGDYIKISGQKLGIIEDERNEIQVVSISKELRDSSNISLTVDNARRNDSLVEKILSGLNR